ncbi:MAG TPA: helix-turn-helix domain-containing protein, partial [Mesorhizobium sp.]|nr:helix-turn-helix domain-containing protein [Mesorhizobium sp.]
ASHTVEARMCRWLLHMRDFADSGDLTLTQDFLAQMLGVRRPSVSLVANTLQKADLIKYRRGRIHVLDVNGLKKGACECYATVKAHYGRLLAD